MGIKDKVLDILFDDENDKEASASQDFSNNEKKSYKASSFLDTGSIFIDATSPLPKTNSNQKSNQEKQNSYEPNQKNDSGYQLSENISPIFGPIDNKNKKNKNLAKVKNYIDNKTFDNSQKNQTPAYTSVVISPIYGPISTKPIKKVSKPRKKATDPFERNINDTGSFDAVIDENDDLEPTPNFEDAVEETVDPADTMGDTDRLVKISDRINRIKNEAANIYNEDHSSEDDQIDEDGYNVETIEHEHISDVIHSVQKYDTKIEHPVKPLPQSEPEPESDTKQEPESETKSEPQAEPQDQESTNDVSDLPFYSDPIEERPYLDDDEIHGILPVERYYDEPSDDNEKETTESTNQSVSVDDIFEDEDDSEEDKDLFSVLFGDE